jgi:hypothetical protein
MSITVPRHLNKRPLIAGLEPIELLGIAALLIGTNIACKMFSAPQFLPAVTSGVSYILLKISRRGKAPGHFIHVLKNFMQPKVISFVEVRRARNR